MITLNIASHKAREKNLKKCLTSAFNSNTQPDIVNVYLNDYKKPRWIKTLEKKHESLCVVEAPDGDIGCAGKFYFLDEQETGVYLTLDDDLTIKPHYIGYLADSAYRYPTSVVGLHGTNFLKFPITDWYNHGGEKQIFYCYNGLSEDKIVDCLGTGVIAFRVDLIKPLNVYKSIKNYGRMCDPVFLKICKENKVSSVCLHREDRLVSEQEGSQDSAIWKELVDKENRAQNDIINSIDPKLFKKPNNVFKINTASILDASISWGHIKIISDAIKRDSKVVEFGSGFSTGYFNTICNDFISFEHDEKWVKPSSRLRPIKKGWYSLNEGDKNRISQADVIIIDGPPGQNGLRYNLDIDLLPKKALIFVDDCHREKDLEMAESIAKKLKKKIDIVESGIKKLAIIS